MHLHLDNNNCLETMMVRGDIQKIRDLTKHLSENHAHLSLKVSSYGISY
jgi:CopG family transcriptional regulator, nickel-responsive regulator